MPEEKYIHELSYTETVKNLGLLDSPQEYLSKYYF